MWKRMLGCWLGVSVLLLGLQGCGCGAGKSSAMLETSADAKSSAKCDTAMAGEAADACYPPGEEVEFNTEEYNYQEENAFLSVKAHPQSAFSADVDTASYSNIRRMLNNREPVVEDAVRIEEMINYFHYDYPQPEGEQPFSVTTEIAPCPWNQETKLLLVGLQAKKVERQDWKPSNLVFLVDVSGSMYTQDKLPLVQKAFAMLTENLKPEDVISVVTYASSDQVVLEGASGKEPGKIMEAIRGLEAGGSTAGAQGIETAYKIAEKYFIKDGNNRVILATDGDLNVGPSSEGELTRLVEKKRESKVYLSVMGFGTGNLKDNKMEALADHGNGNYSYIDSGLEAKRVLAEEMGGTLLTVAKDVKFQVEFNPARLKGYRLIGYENRKLNPEDFADDTKDAGEIGAGHRVTVLYELADWDSAQEVRETDLKYQPEDPEAGGDNGEFLTVAIRYKEPEGEESQLLEYPVGPEQMGDAMTDNMKLASGVAQLGMLLKHSAYAGAASYQGIQEQVGEISGAKEDPYVGEFLEMVHMAAQEK